MEDGKDVKMERKKDIEEELNEKRMMIVLKRKKEKKLKMEKGKKVSFGV